MSEALNQQVQQDIIGSVAPITHSLMNEILRSRPAKILVGGAAFVAGLGGAAAYASPASAANGAPIAYTATGYLNDVGPPLPTSNVGEANHELKTELREEGPNSGLAREIAIGAGITTAAGRAKYITPGNVSLLKEVTATNTVYTGDVGLSGEMPVLISNPHPTSTAYTIGLKKIPSESTELTQLKDGEYVIDDEVIRGLCTNALFKKPTPHHEHKPLPKPSKKPVTDTLSVDVTFGVDVAASSYASAKSSSNSTSSTKVTCPDGEVVSAKSKASAEASADAIAEALAEIKAKDDFKIVGKDLSYAKFQAEFNADVKATDAVIAKAAAKTSASTNVNVVCAPAKSTPPPVVVVTPPPVVVVTPPTPTPPTPTIPKEGIEFQQQPPALEQIVAGASPTEIRINTITPAGYQVELVTLEDPDNGNCISTTSAIENSQNPVEYDAWVTAANLPGCAGTDETLVAEVSASNGTNTITAETSMDVGAIQPAPNFGN